MLSLIILGMLVSWAHAAPHLNEITLQNQIFNASDLQIDDMKFGPGEYETLMRKGSLDKLWDLSQPIPYIIADGFEDRVVKIIDAGIKHWESKTCIRFQKYDSAPEEHHLRFFPGKKDACWSYIGRTMFYGQNHQDISIGSGHCEQMFVVAHEVGHAIGFYHEQMRFDRDDWITIDTNNINPGDMNNFDKHTEDGSRGIEYDYYSVMQYGTTAASSTGYSTMVPKDILAFHLMGANEVGLTIRDRLMAQKMYQCEAEDEEMCGKKCQNYGVLNSDCSCECEPGVSGDLCESRDRPYIEARHDEIMGYMALMYYHRVRGFNIRTAEWGIQKAVVDAESGWCATLEYSGQSLADCDVAYLLVRIGDQSTKYCGSNLPNGKIVSTNNEIRYTYVTTSIQSSFSVTPGRTSC